MWSNHIYPLRLGSVTQFYLASDPLSLSFSLCLPLLPMTVLAWAAQAPSYPWTECCSSWTPRTQWTSTELSSTCVSIAHTWFRLR